MILTLLPGQVYERLTTVEAHLHAELGNLCASWGACVLPGVPCGN